MILQVESAGQVNKNSQAIVYTYHLCCYPEIMTVHDVPGV